MTEPMQEPGREVPTPAPAEPAPIEASGAPDEAAAPVEPAAPAESPPSGWVQPSSQGGGMSRGCCLILAIVGGIVGILVVVALAFTFFLGSQIQSMLAGTVEFEAGDVAGCYVQQPTDTFPASTTIHFAAHFARRGAGRRDGHVGGDVSGWHVRDERRDV